MKVVLMGLEFSINNLGCEALSYSFVKELYDIVAENGDTLEASTIVFADKKVPYIPGTEIPVRCIGIHYKKPSFWKEIKKAFREADFIFDFTMGDSFSDIYGKKRFILDALVKDAAIASGTPYILGPQTYGPYKSGFVRSWARKIIKRAHSVYARDEQSKEVAEKISGRKVCLTTDVAFSLPYEKQTLGTEGKIKVGINPSGLLWKGGYTENNQFGLSIDYKSFCEGVCARIVEDDRYELFLIPHVGTSGQSAENAEDNYENDGVVCRFLQKKFPAATVLDDIHTPMDVKGYIAAMDVFVGARMHATIGAFSAGVATVPVSYSRKFEGLYGSLGYEYLIHAKESTTEEAISDCLKYIEEYMELKARVAKSMEQVESRKEVFRSGLKELITSGK